MLRRQIRRSVINSAIVAGAVLLYFGFLACGGFLGEYDRGRALSAGDGDLVFLLVLGGVGLPLGLFFMGRAVLYFCLPRLHPIMRRLEEFGPPDEVADEIDRELEDRREVSVVGTELSRYDLSRAMGSTVFVTRNWLLQPTQFGLRVVHLDDVLGVCKFVFSPRFRHQDEPDLSDLSAPGYSNGVEVKMRGGKDERFVLPSDEVQYLLVVLFRRVPWALSGFDAGDEGRWSGDREGLFGDVQAARQQIMALSPEQRRSLVDDKVKEAEEKIRIIRDRDPRRG
jgi:hypothetical protein